MQLLLVIFCSFCKAIPRFDLMIAMKNCRFHFPSLRAEPVHLLRFLDCLWQSLVDPCTVVEGVCLHGRLDCCLPGTSPSS